jgi:hypothetical protein
VLVGCETETVTRESTDSSSDNTSSTTPISPATDPAEYEFHRNEALTDVTKDLPDGSVDHIDLDLAAAPNVIVVVTVTAPYHAGMQFITTFAGPNDLSITKEWAPASAGDQDDQHVGLFVLPGAVQTGSTTVR